MHNIILIIVLLVIETLEIIFKIAGINDVSDLAPHICHVVNILKNGVLYFFSFVKQSIRISLTLALISVNF